MPLQQLKRLQQLTRRQLLLLGLGVGAFYKGWERQQQLLDQQRKENLAANLVRQSPELIRADLEKAINADRVSLAEIEAVEANLTLRSPTQPYERPRSQELILCSRLATEQYLTGKFQPDFDGAIQALPSYSDQLQDYQYVAAIRGPEEATSQKKIAVPTNVSELLRDQDRQVLMQDNRDAFEYLVRETAGQTLNVKWRSPVFWGFVLTSPMAHIIVFRGTQRPNEWLQNLNARQIRGTENLPFYCAGRVHQGFANVYSSLAETTAELARQLDPAKPCYISGHSLGAALATLAALDLAVRVPALKEQLRLYTYASPRVGNPAFAETHSRLVPNTYRVVNAADTFAMTPPTQLQETVFVHVGETWQFLWNRGDIGPNHLVATYRTAIDQERETKGVDSSPQTV